MSHSLLTIPKAADHCGVSRSTMWRWAKTGQITTALTAGGHYRIRLQDLEDFIRENQLAPMVRGSSPCPRILVVDDDPHIRRLLDRGLSHQDLDIDYAGDGFEAGKKTMTFQPDLIILDLYLPRLNGFEVCRMIKEDPATAQIRIIAISGADETASREKILARGADAFFPKPLDIRQMKRAINSLLDLPPIPRAAARALALKSE